MRALMVCGIVVGGLCLLAGCQTGSVRGPGGQAMTVETPMTVTIQRGQTETMKIGIDRKNFVDAVTVSVSQLPAGVTVDEPSKKIETDAATFLLKAAKDATLVVNQAMAVKVSGPEGMAVTKHVKLTVKE